TLLGPEARKRTARGPSGLAPAERTTPTRGSVLCGGAVWRSWAVRCQLRGEPRAVKSEARRKWRHLRSGGITAHDHHTRAVPVGNTVPRISFRHRDRRNSLLVCLAT